MPNTLFDLALRIRLFSPVIKPTQCPKCQSQITEDGHHAFSCPALQDNRTQRHTRVSDAMLSVVRSLKHQNIRVTPNKNMDSYAKTPAGIVDGKQHYMDVEIINTNEGPASAYIVDFVVKGVSSSTQALRSAAAAAEEVKVKKYTSNYIINQPDKHLVPWAMEAPGGAWGVRGIKFARYLAAEQRVHGGSLNAPAFFRMIVVRMSVALQCMNAEAVRRLDATCQAAAQMAAPQQD